MPHSLIEGAAPEQCLSPDETLMFDGNESQSGFRDALFHYGVLNCDAHEVPVVDAFDRLAGLANGLFGVNTAFTAFPSVNRQQFVFSMDLGRAQRRCMSTLCARTLAKDGLLVVRDGTAVERIAEAGAEAACGFFAGVPARTATGKAIGTFCVMGSSAHTLSVAKRRRLEDLGQMASAIIRAGEKVADKP